MDTKSSRFSLETLLSIAGVLISLVALILAFRANRTATLLADEANSLIERQNEIALLGVSSVLGNRVTRTNTIGTFWNTTCRYESSEQNLSYRLTEAVYDFYNNGGLGSSLVAVDLSAGSVDWDIDVYDSSEEVMLPVNIPPGSAVKLRFLARSISREDVVSVWETDAAGNSILRWTFEFSNSDTLSEEITKPWSIGGVGGSDKCEDYDEMKRLFEVE